MRHVVVMIRHVEDREEWWELKDTIREVLEGLLP